MCDNKKTWLVVDDDGDSHVCRTVEELEDMYLGGSREVIGSNYDLCAAIEETPDMDLCKVYEISGSEATEIDISFKMKLSIRL